MACRESVSTQESISLTQSRVALKWFNAEKCTTLKAGPSGGGALTTLHRLCHGLPKRTTLSVCWHWSCPQASLSWEGFILSKQWSAAFQRCELPCSHRPARLELLKLRRKVVYWKVHPGAEGPCPLMVWGQAERGLRCTHRGCGSAVLLRNRPKEEQRIETEEKMLFWKNQPVLLLLFFFFLYPLITVDSWRQRVK